MDKILLKNPTRPILFLQYPLPFGIIFITWQSRIKEEKK